jgi:hypothetical protein
MTNAKIKELYGLICKIDEYDEVLDALRDVFNGDADGLQLVNDPGDGVKDYIFSVENVPGLLECMIGYVTKKKNELQKIIDEA